MRANERRSLYRAVKAFDHLDEHLFGVRATNRKARGVLHRGPATSLGCSGAVSPSDLAHTMSSAFGAPLLDLDAIDAQRLPRNLLDTKICVAYRVVVLSKRNNRLIVATADPSDQQAADKIKSAGLTSAVYTL